MDTGYKIEIIKQYGMVGYFCSQAAYVFWDYIDRFKNIKLEKDELPVQKKFFKT
jgi:hypothetical protein